MAFLTSRKKTAFIVGLTFFFAVSGLAQEKNLVPVVKSKYFSVYADRSVDINSLLTRLNFDYFLQLETVLGSGGKDPASILAKTLDAIYSEVSDILDIHIYSYHGTIKILPDRTAIGTAVKSLFGREFPERAFYVHEMGTLYISARDVTVGMLGHEIAHAIQCNYFVVPPPAKVQEVLSGYVEYTLRKSMGTLP